MEKIFTSPLANLYICIQSYYWLHISNQPRNKNPLLAQANKNCFQVRRTIYVTDGALPFIFYRRPEFCISYAKVFFLVTIWTQLICQFSGWGKNSHTVGLFLSHRRMEAQSAIFANHFSEQWWRDDLRKCIQHRCRCVECIQHSVQSYPTKKICQLMMANREVTRCLEWKGKRKGNQQRILNSRVSSLTMKHDIWLFRS